MKMPAGTQGGIALDPRKGDTLENLRGFKGLIEVETDRGKGFILMRNGELVAACFEDKEQMYRGDAALRYIMATPAGGSDPNQQQFALRPYSDKDFAEALDRCTERQLFIGSAPVVQKSPPPLYESAQVPRQPSGNLDEATLTKIMAQPGVVAVSAFYEGFPVISRGNADFEHVAARAEDLLRTGTTIALDMSLGRPDQLILETAENKFIISPFGDLCLCIIARSDAQLGLLRVLIRSLQHEAGHS